MTVDKLKSCSRSDLATMAKKYAVPGWYAMRKDQLIKALLKVLPSVNRSAATRSPASKTSRNGNGIRRTTSTSDRGPNPRVNGNNKPKSNGHSGIHATSGSTRDRRAAGSAIPGRPSFVGRTFRNQNSRILKATADCNVATDTLTAEPHDSHWILAKWVLSQHTIQRAEAALAIEWRQAIPVIRVYDVTAGDSDVIVANWVRDVEVHGGVQEWFVPVEEALRSYRLELGYLAPSGHFFVLARSKSVKTPRPGTLAHRNGDANHRESNGNGHSRNGSSRNGSRLSRRVERSPRNGSNGHSENHWHGEFPFEVHTELVVHGTTHPNAKFTLLGEEVQLEADGSFSLRIALPDGRQVIPAVAVTPNGAEQRTIVLGVERNTRQLEPQNLNDPY